MDTSDNKISKRRGKVDVRNFQVTFYRRSLESGGFINIFHVRSNSTLELVQIQCTQSPDAEKLERNSKNLELPGAKSLESNNFWIQLILEIVCQCRAVHDLGK